MLGAARRAMASNSTQFGTRVLAHTFMDTCVRVCPLRCSASAMQRIKSVAVNSPVAEPRTAELNLCRPFLNVAEHHRLPAEPKLVAP